MNSSISYIPRYVPDWGWGEFPSDLLKEVADKRLEFSSICVMAAVCKRWEAIVSNNSFGEHFLKRIGVHAQLAHSWMKTFRIYTRRPQILVLDNSASMKYEYRATGQLRKKIAMDKITEICTTLSDAIKHGMYCILFNDTLTIKKCRTVKEAIGFFSKREYHMFNNGLGTDINRLFNFLSTLQPERNRKRFEVTIISDFDCHMVFPRLIRTDHIKMHVQCLNLGDSDALKEFDDDFQLWKKDSIQEKYAQAKAERRARNAEIKSQHKQIYDDFKQKVMLAQRGYIGSRSAKKLHRSFPHPLAATFSSFAPKKRSRNSEEYDLPLTIKHGSPDSWQPFTKKRKITFHL